MRSAARHLDRGRLHLPGRRAHRVGHQRSSAAGAVVEIFFGIISLIAGVVMLAWRACRC